MDGRGVAAAGAISVACSSRWMERSESLAAVDATDVAAAPTAAAAPAAPVPTALSQVPLPSIPSELVAAGLSGTCCTDGAKCSVR